MKPTTSNRRQTWLAQVAEVVDRIPTIQAMADGRRDTPDPDRRNQLPTGDDEIELAAPYSDPTAAAMIAQAGARSVMADIAIFQAALARASSGARRLVPKTVECCHGCGEPVGARKAVTFRGETYHLSPCEMRARRAEAKSS